MRGGVHGIVAGLVGWSLALAPLTAIAIAIAGVLGVAYADSVLDALCHRLPERSLAWPDGTPLPICARCTGLYLGALFGVALGSSCGRLAITEIPRSWWLALAAAVLGITDGLAHVLGLWDEANLPRAISGAVLGAGAFFLASVVTRSLVRQLAESTDRGRGAT